MKAVIETKLTLHSQKVLVGFLIATALIVLGLISYQLNALLAILMRIRLVDVAKTNLLVHERIRFWLY